MPRISAPLRPEWATIGQAEFRKNFSQISSLQGLAAFFRLQPFQLSYYAYKVDKNRVYTTFCIPRRNGKQRRIESPTRTLKFIQRLIHESLTRIYGPHPAVHGFRVNKSIVTNARNHTNRRYVLNLDLADFFPSITRQRIYGRLVAAPYLLNSNVANLIAALSTNAYSQLPQGSPSSPVIANILAAEMDSDLAKLCGSLHCRYTRYADDITISTSRNELSPELARYPSALGTGQVIVGDRLRDIVERHGFQVNDRKSRLHSHWTRQMCTGLVVNNNRVTPPRSYVRRLRSLLDHWKKDGWQDAARILSVAENRPLLDDRQRLLNHVLGKVAYLRMVRGPGDPACDRFEQKILSLP